ncbi:Spy/CpxP family protein refolding chaperone [Colwellia sp. E2M01]|uniref:Spy/CpxP family protein refolding chaperone n=1 Tax=Colwellia sp. E2M01 TaxID=2841561 RepID=UPI001C08F9E2|nr:Spy/CpxP family protein refolding chaperone [Colwellia sp. E2M01]MBU2871540.1 Spy/CpxP family protein refolding chaperone [Colwellia sp. E2M01]
MKITFKTLAIATSLCSALVLSPVSFANADNPDSAQVEKRQQMHEKRFAKMAKKLDLTESQQAEVKALKAQEKLEKDALKPAFKAYKDQVKTLMSAEFFDEQAFTQLQESNQDVFVAMALIKAKNKFAMKNILTAEQLKKFKRMEKKMKRKMDKKRSRKMKKSEKESETN